MDIEQARFNMVAQQIHPCGVFDKRVLDALMKCPRELFVPEPYKQLAFADTQIPLENNQYMLEPKLVGKIIQALNLNGNQSVLEIGTGSGYMTALLAELAQKVTSIEIFRDLYEQARKRLQTINLQNIEMLNEDAIKYLQTPKSFDRIVLTGSVAVFPDEVGTLLSNNGKAFAITGKPPTMEASVLTRNNQGGFSRVVLSEACIPPLIGFQVSREFEF